MLKIFYYIILTFLLTYQFLHAEDLKTYSCKRIQKRHVYFDHAGIKDTVKKDNRVFKLKINKNKAMLYWDDGGKPDIFKKEKFYYIKQTKNTIGLLSINKKSPKEDYGKTIIL